MSSSEVPHDAQKTLCTNAYCLREHIKWENLTHTPTIDKHAHGAWSGYNWRPKNKNKGGFRKKKYEGQGTQNGKDNKGPRDQHNNGGHQNPYPRRGHDNNQSSSNNHDNTPTYENHRESIVWDKACR